MPGLQCSEHKELLESAGVFLCGHMPYAERRTDARIVGQSSAMLGEDPQRPRHLSTMLNLCDAADLALADGFGVLEEPFLPARPGRPWEGLGVAAGCRTLKALLPGDGFTNYGRLSSQNSSEQFAAAAGKLALREREAFCDLHATGARIRDLRQRYELCGTGQKKAAWALVRVYAALDGQQNLRRALNFIDDCPIETSNEAHRIGPRRVEGRLIVQGQKGPLAIGELFRQCRLARLLRPCDQHHARIRQGFLHRLLDEPGRHEGLSNHGRVRPVVIRKAAN